VSTAEAKALLGKALILDVRRKATYLEGRLPGAQSVAPKGEGDARAFEPAIFGPNKSAPILIYGHGTDGWSAVLAVKNAAAAGYTNVNWMREGWKAWSEEKLPTEQ
jgi:rhodanese-related sulfurtransferase